MDLSGTPNIQNKLSIIKGGSVADSIMGGIAGIVFAGISILSFIVGGYLFGAIILIVGIGIAWASFSSIPKEKKKVLESWARLSPAEVYEIEKEAPIAPFVGSAFVTHDAVVVKLSQGPLVIPARDIMWVYGREVTTKMYGLVSTGKTFGTIIVDRQGERNELGATNTGPKLKDGQPRPTDNQLQTIHVMLKPKYPGIIFGYRQELEALTTKENISQLAQLVDAENQKARAN